MLRAGTDGRIQQWGEGDPTRKSGWHTGHNILFGVNNSEAAPHTDIWFAEFVALHGREDMKWHIGQLMFPVTNCYYNTDMVLHNVVNKRETHTCFAICAILISHSSRLLLTVWDSPP
jgi:hypothetical protein